MQLKSKMYISMKNSRGATPGLNQRSSPSEAIAQTPGPQRLFFIFPSSFMLPNKNIYLQKS